MKVIQVVGEEDDEHRLHAELPVEIPGGLVRVIVLPVEDEAGSLWERGGAAKWSEDLSDRGRISTPSTTPSR